MIRIRLLATSAAVALLAVAVFVVITPDPDAPRRPRTWHTVTSVPGGSASPGAPPG